MIPFPDRLKALTGDDWGHKRKLAAWAKVSEPTAEDYLCGKSLPSVAVAARIAEATGCSLDWLIAGKGEPFPEPPEPRIELVKADLRPCLIQEDEPDFEAPEYAAIPLMADAAAAGDAAIVRDVIDGWVVIYASWLPHGARKGAVTAFRVHGQSMTPFLPDGSIVAVDHRRRDPDENIDRLVAAHIPLDDAEAGVTVKILRRARSKGDFLLEATNPTFPAIVAHNPGPEWLLGRVIFTHAKLT